MCDECRLVHASMRMATEMRCELVSWHMISRLAHRLSHQIRADGFQPDIVVAIARGGYVPARLLCDFLDIYDLTSIRILHYAAGSRKIEKPRLYMPLAVDIRDRKVLLVDDVTDSGDTLQLAIDHVREHGPSEMKTAVLQHKQVSSMAPDYYAHKVITWRWLVYPWAVIEDISSFMSQMRPRPASLEEATERLQLEYGIKVSDRELADAFALLQDR